MPTPNNLSLNASNDPDADPAALRAKFSDFRHAVINSLSVMVAMAEMARRDPAKFPRLVELVLEKGEFVQAELLRFNNHLEEHLSASSHKESPPPNP